MNTLIMKLMVCAIAACFLFSCAEESDNNEVRQSGKILHSPPFAGITDSISKSPDNVQLLLTRATRLAQHNFHEIATADYKKAYELTGDENIALEYTSSLLLASHVEKAMDILKEGRNKFPQNTEFSRRLAEIYLQNNANSQALKEYDNIIAHDSINFEAWFDKGSLLARMKDTTAALTALEKSFSILPVNYTGMALANIYIARKDPRVLEICDIILQRDSTGVHTEPVYMKGVYYTEVKDYNNAIKQFDECIRRDWKMTDAHIEKGIIFFEQKKFDEAIKIFNMAATVSNTDADAYYWLGRCYEAMGNRQEAITNYRRALALDDTFSEAKDGLRRMNS